MIVTHDLGVGAATNRIIRITDGRIVPSQTTSEHISAQKQ